jgi:hypothetical protein
MRPAATLAAFSILSATDAQMIYDRKRTQKEVDQHNRNLCVKCFRKIPPGEPGRACKDCRDA